MDLTMTAVRRPPIVEATLKSFMGAFDGYKDHRLLINIDPVGGTKTDEKEVINVCESFFDNLTVKTPLKPSFPKAFKWCWENTESDIVFHLEDDWQLVKDIDIKAIKKILADEPDLALLRLSVFCTGNETTKTWNKFIPWNGKYFECPEDLKGAVGFCGHPSFIKKEFIDICLPHLDDDKNPEKIFHSRGSGLEKEILKWRYGIFSEQNSRPTINDIGRRWISKTNWQKKGNKAHFTEWEETLRGEK